MIYERIYLKDYFPCITSNANLKCFVNENKERNMITKAVIVVPGGGYEFVADNEGEPVAMQFQAAGFATFVLTYSVHEFSYPQPFSEAFAAILYVKQNAERFRIDPNKIVLCGFSAGGHLIGTVGTLIKDQEMAKLFGVSNNELSVAGLIFGYPVITLKDELTHKGTKDCLGTSGFEALKFSIDELIDKDYPKSFIWTTANDELVNPKNSLLLAQKLIENNVLCELHIYPSGRHGLSIARDEEEDFSDIQTWVTHAVMFVKNRI